ncbi:MAG: DUF4112 domain-containing protein [Hyphomicrobiaceae bacterium]
MRDVPCDFTTFDLTRQLLRIAASRYCARFSNTYVINLGRTEEALAVIDRQVPWQSPRRQAERMPLGMAEADAAYARVEALARVMDSMVALPGTNIRLGVDAVLGLIPVVGDVISHVISSYIIWEARRLGVSRWTMTRMIGNSVTDFAIGIVPLVGDAFDVAFRANMRNLALLKAEMERKGLGRRTIDL